MGTRADFYVGRGEDAEWLGSIAWDGYPDGIGREVREATTRDDFEAALGAFFTTRDDVTRPEHGWPWPWEDSGTTDYAYALDDGKVWVSCFGGEWFVGDEPPDEDDAPPRTKGAVFPNMRDRQKVTYGSRSGVVVIDSSGPVPAAEIDAEEASNASTTTEPSTLTDEQHAVVRGLRSLADYLEQHPELPAPGYASASIYLAWGISADDATVLVAALAPCEVVSDSLGPRFVRRFDGGVKLEMGAPRSLIVEHTEQVTVKGLTSAVARIAAGGVLAHDTGSAA